MTQMKTISCGTLARVLLLICSSTAGGAAKEASELIFQDDFNGKLAGGWTFEREERANWRVGPTGLEVRV